MSHTGKLLRGLKWYSWRDVDGVLPKDISEDEDKMVDIDYYLEFVKGKDIKAVNKILLDIRYFERGMTKSGTMMKGTKKIVNELKVKLESNDLLTKEEIERRKKEAEAKTKAKAEALKEK